MSFRTSRAMAVCAAQASDFAPSPGEAAAICHVPARVSMRR